MTISCIYTEIFHPNPDTRFAFIIYGFVMNQQNSQLAVGFLGHLYFQAFFSLLFSSIRNCDAPSYLASSPVPFIVWTTRNSSTHNLPVSFVCSVLGKYNYLTVFTMISGRITLWSFDSIQRMYVGAQLQNTLPLICICIRQLLRFIAEWTVCEVSCKHARTTGHYSILVAASFEEQDT